MFIDLILAGTLIGAAIGILHAVAIYRDRRRTGGQGPGTALWYAAWAAVLWTLFGGYLLILWLAGGALWLVLGGWRRPEAAR